MKKTILALALAMGITSMAATAQTLTVANSYNDTIDEVSTNGTVTTFIGFPEGYNAGISDPLALAFDSLGNLFVANTGNNTVSKVTTNGTVSTFATGFVSPRGLAFNAQGNLFVANDDTNNNTVSEVTTDGTVSTFATGFDGPSALAYESLTLPVPEPSTYALLGLGGLALVVAFRRKIA